MADNEEKSKKLKEIQDRLAEIKSKSPADKEISDQHATAKQSGSGKVQGADSDKKPGEQKKPASSKTASTGDKKAVEKKVAEPKTAAKKTGTPKAEPVRKDIQTPVDPDKKPEPEIPKSQPAETTAGSWSENKVKSPDADKSGPANEKARVAGTAKSRTGLSKIYTFFSLLVTAVVIGYLLYLSFFQGDSTADGSANQTTSVANQSEQSDAPAGEESVSENVSEPVSVSIDSRKDVKPQKEEKVREETRPVAREKQAGKENPAVKSTGSAAKSNAHKGRVPEGFIISYASNSEQSMAEKNVSTLRSKGFKADYYYMPDKNTKDPALYKVYVGPYSSESAAFPDFKKIVNINKGAFILKMN